MQELFTQLPCLAFFLRISLVFFSTSFLAIMIWCPQPKHFSLKSAPTRRISHSLLPHGCCFFNRTTSPTSYSVSYTHLDVYKRQLLSSRQNISSIRLFFLPPNGSSPYVAQTGINSHPFLMYISFSMSYNLLLIFFLFNQHL